MFETVAYAMGAPGGGAAGQQPSMLQSMLPLIIIFGIFYFLLIRPQQKKAKEHKTVLDNLKKGDRVITNGGIYGEVFALTPDTVTLVVAENVKIKVVKSYIAGLAGQEDIKPE
jgi:preprotein translocase subunit YajC